MHVTHKFMKKVFAVFNNMYCSACSKQVLITCLFLVSQLYRENMSSGHCTPSSGASSAGSEPRQCMVALHDYDPIHSGISGRPPQDQLSLKKGDIMTAFGDIDVNGFYRVDVNGENLFSVLAIKIEFLRTIKWSMYVMKKQETDHPRTNWLTFKYNSNKPSIEKGNAKNQLYLEINSCELCNTMSGPLSIAFPLHFALTSISLSLIDSSIHWPIDFHLYTHFLVPLLSPQLRRVFWETCQKFELILPVISGQTGFVPGHMVEEVSSSSFLQPVSPVQCYILKSLNKKIEETVILIFLYCCHLTRQAVELPSRF